MSRLIDADAFIEEARNRIDMQDLYLPVHIKEMVLDEMPTVDAVPVVRCKDCKYRKPKKTTTLNSHCVWYNRAVMDDDYCSKAERKEE